MAQNIIMNYHQSYFTSPHYSSISITINAQNVYYVDNGFMNTVSLPNIMGGPLIGTSLLNSYGQSYNNSDDESSPFVNQNNGTPNPTQSFISNDQNSSSVIIEELKEIKEETVQSKHPFLKPNEYSKQQSEQEKESNK